MLSQGCSAITCSDQAAGNLMSGNLDGQSVQVLVDTGSHMSVARADLVDQGKWKERSRITMCAW